MWAERKREQRDRNNGCIITFVTIESQLTCSIIVLFPLLLRLLLLAACVFLSFFHVIRNFSSLLFIVRRFVVSPVLVLFNNLRFPKRISTRHDRFPSTTKS